MPEHDPSQHFPLPCDPDGEDCPIGDDLADALRAALVDLIGEHLTAAHAVELADVARRVQLRNQNAPRVQHLEPRKPGPTFARLHVTAEGDAWNR